jgi:putative DNA methylase
VFGLFAEVDRRKPMTSSLKKLSEIALSLEAINKELAREKSIRHGHSSTLPSWWA